jgi:hypothetical protein
MPEVALHCSKKRRHLPNYRAHESGGAALILSKTYITTGIKSVVN